MKLRDAAPTRRVLVVAIMVSMVAFLDSTVVNLALPAIQRDLGGGLSLQQWVVDGYLLALAAMILPAGSIADLFGRVPVMRFGLATFGTGSVLAATAATPAILITGRVIQGLGGAFLVPGSLALINSAFDRADRPAAIGAWTAWTSTAFALGPLLGGLAVDFLSWRWIYVLSAIPMVIGFALTFWLRPMPRPAERATRRRHRRRVVSGRAGRHGVCTDRISAARMERPSRDHIDDLGGRGVAGGRGIGPAAPHPDACRWACSRSATSPVPIWPPRSSTAPSRWACLPPPCTPRRSPATRRPSRVWPPCPPPSSRFCSPAASARMAARIGPRIFVMTGPVVAGFGLLLIRPSGHGFNVVTQTCCPG